MPNMRTAQQWDVVLTDGGQWAEVLRALLAQQERGRYRKGGVASVRMSGQDIRIEWKEPTTYGVIYNFVSAALGATECTAGMKVSITRNLEREQDIDSAESYYLIWRYAQEIRKKCIW